MSGNLERLRAELAARFEPATRPDADQLTPVILQRALGIVVGALDQLAVEIDGPASHMAAAGVRRAAALVVDASPWQLHHTEFLQDRPVSTMPEVTDEPLPWEREERRGDVAAAAKRLAAQENRFRDPGSVRRAIKRRVEE